MRHGALSAVVSGIAVLAASPALAFPEPVPRACSDAFSAAPDAAKAGKLLAARAQLVLCAADPCPATMRQLCAQDLRHLEDQLPTVVFVARGAKGEDLLDVRVIDNGNVLVERLDGRAVAVDPGPHRFRFERAGGSAIETAVLLNEGEKARAVSVVLSGGEDASIATTPTARPVPWTVILAGSVTAVAAAGFGTFGIWGVVGRSNLASCKGSCSASSVDDVSTRFTIADVSLVTGVVALAATAILYFTRPEVRQGPVDLAGTELLWRAAF